MISRYDMLVSELCAEIDDLRQQVALSECDAKHWRDEYQKLLREDIDHAQKMMVNVVDALLEKTKLEKVPEPCPSTPK